MESVLSALVSIGPIAFLAALSSVPIYYFSYRSAPEPKQQRSVLRYVLMAFVVGALAFVIGTVVGVSAACSSADSGNLCGLVGFLGIGPLVSAAAIILYARSWSKNARRAP